jgi:hypothetical protein
VTALRLLIVLIYPAAVVLLAWRRPRQAAATARAAGCAIDHEWFVRPRGTPRLVVWIAGALLVSLLGRGGMAIALLLALLSAPYAAAGTLRLLATCRAGLLVDERLHPWSEFAAFTTRRATAELIVMWSGATREPLRFHVVGRPLDAIAAALGHHLPQLTDDR